MHRNSFNLRTCAGVRPVKQNIPIWSVMWFHGLVEPIFSKLPFNWARTLMIRSAMPLTSSNHSARNCLSLKISRTRCAPWIGGFEYIGRIRIFNWDETRSASSLSLQTSEKAPIRSPYKPKKTDEWQRYVRKTSIRKYECNWCCVSYPCFWRSSGPMRIDDPPWRTSARRRRPCWCHRWRILGRQDRRMGTSYASWSMPTAQPIALVLDQHRLDCGHRRATGWSNALGFSTK